MPIYTDKNITRKDLKELAKKNVCNECQAHLDIFTEFGKDVYYLACHDWPKTHHEGIEREASQYEQRGLEALNIPTRREIVTEQIGVEKAKALDKYIGVTSLTRPQAKEILVSVYPEAPMAEITRAVILCASYGLNPLMKHIFLIPFNKKKGGQVVGVDWVTVLGSKAKWLLASRKGTISFVDDTPRIMTEQEQNATFGEVYKDKINVVVKLKDPQNDAISVGYGNWPKTKEPYGTDKGNTKFNMARIRAESQALDRLRPGEMPSGIEAMPEEVANSIEGECTVVEEKQNETTEEEHVCPIHNVPFVLCGRGKKKWYAHKVEGTEKEWCSESKVLKQLEESGGDITEVKEEPIETAEKPTELLIDMDWLNDSLKTLKWKEPALKSFISYKYQINTEGSIQNVLARLSKEHQEALIKEIQERLEYS